MVSRLGLILFTALFLFGCASNNKNNEVQVEQNNNKENINKKYTTKYSKILKETEISSFAIDISKIVNKQDALNFLGEPLDKIIFLLQWKTTPNNPISYEYIEFWKWKKPIAINIIFNEKGDVFKKFQLTIIDFINKK
jgi:hypothetical protein